MKQPMKRSALVSTAEMIERTYGHHHPDYMRAAAAAITRVCL
jgi:hypothetical protein